MDVSKFCLLCESLLDSSPTVVVTRGLENLKRCSNERKDGLCDQMELHTSLEVHITCRQQYINQRKIAQSAASHSAPETSAGPLLRSSLPVFQFKTHCIFCGDVADAAAELKRPKSRRRVISEVLTTTFQDNVHRVVRDRDDDWGKEVQHRINAVDIRALDGRYHQDCYAKFASMKSLYGTQGSVVILLESKTRIALLQRMNSILQEN